MQVETCIATVGPVGISQRFVLRPSACTDLELSFSLVCTHSEMKAKFEKARPKTRVSLPCRMPPANSRS